MFLQTDRSVTHRRNAIRSKEEVVQEFRVQSLQEATMRVIARKGIEGATMQDIADEAGVAKGTIYLYFRDRDELVEKTFDNAVHQLHRRVDEALESDGPFEDRLRESLLRVFAFFRENSEFFRLYIAQRFPQTADRRRTQPQCDRYRERMVKLAGVLKQAMERGEIRSMDPLRLAMFIAEGTNAIAIERVVDENPPPPEADVELILSVLLDGVRSKRSAR